MNVNYVSKFRMPLVALEAISWLGQIHLIFYYPSPSVLLFFYSSARSIYHSPKKGRNIMLCCPFLLYQAWLNIHMLYCYQTCFLDLLFERAHILIYPVQLAELVAWKFACQSSLFSMSSSLFRPRVELLSLSIHYNRSLELLPSQCCS